MGLLKLTLGNYKEARLQLASAYSFPGLFFHWVKECIQFFH